MSGSKNCGTFIYTMEYYVAERKKELLPFETAWIELVSIMPSDRPRFPLKCFKELVFVFKSQFSKNLKG